ncbi:hypothetical protein ACFL96_20600 [Thermoproteota archaeon]
MCNEQKKESKEDKKELDHIISVWKVAINTQMHFNDLLIKMRTTVISIILAVFGASVIALKDINFKFEIFDCKVHASVVILGIGCVFLFTQFILDFFYYFKLLLGAVDFTEKMDRDYSEYKLFGLTSMISKRISHHCAGVVLFLCYAIPFGLFAFAMHVIHNRILAK